jgi:ubiquinone/menaquinone biosynthesis C-methylase UbiE
VVPDEQGDGWSALAAWYDERQAETGDLWHRSLIDPGLEQVVGEVSGLRLLDLGCGNGYLARRFAGRGATVVAVDVTAAMLERARARGDGGGRVRYLQADASDLRELASGSVDLVYANMSLHDIPDAEAALAEVGRLLRAGGRLVASISHPCFDTDLNSSWVTERIHRSSRTGRLVWQYREPFRSESPWHLGGGSTCRTGSYHRPLSWYARALRSSGLWIEELVEPRPGPEFWEKDPEAASIQEIPLHLVIGARRGELPD